jgi:hypothetical protein
MLKTLLHVLNYRWWVHHIDDERNEGNSIIVTLKEGWYFADEPGCGVKGFDTVAEVLLATKQSEVVFK